MKTQNSNGIIAAVKLFTACAILGLLVAAAVAYLIGLCHSGAGLDTLGFDRTLSILIIHVLLSICFLLIAVDLLRRGPVKRSIRDALNKRCLGAVGGLLGFAGMTILILLGASW